MSRSVFLRLRGFGVALTSVLLVVQAGCGAEERPFQLPTANRAIYQPGAEGQYFVGTVGQPWISGTFGCVRSEGWRFHEGLDIRCLQRDERGEPVDPVLAAADGRVAYVNARPSLSNYGNYIVLSHQVDGLEVHTLYAHLGAVQKGLKAGSKVRRGEVIGTMGRTTDTREPITRDRAHLHFEMGLLLNPRFAAWQRKNEPKVRNDHGSWNGRNLAGFDPRAVFLAQRARGAKFNLVGFLRSQPELCRVFVRAKSFPFLKTYEPLVIRNPRAVGEGIAGYEMALSFNGLPLRLIPRAASEIKGAGRMQLLSVNEAEQQRNPACRLVTQRGGRWELTETGRERLELLLY